MGDRRTGRRSRWTARGDYAEIAAMPGSIPPLDGAYVTKLESVIREWLQLAGFRLRLMLNERLGQ